MHIFRKILGTAVFISLAVVLIPVAWTEYFIREAVIKLADWLEK